jgi:hypothetical protein
MPLIWKRRENPYRINYFSILEVSPATRPLVLQAKRRNLVQMVQGGKPHVVGGRAIAEAEINEAESRLLDPGSRAWELLLAHPVPAFDPKQLRRICRDLAAAATPEAAPRRPRLARPGALAALLPAPSADVVVLPAWEELGVPAAGEPEDRRLDIQFDL